jgi:hypothetical protein
MRCRVFITTYEFLSKHCVSLDTATTMIEFEPPESCPDAASFHSVCQLVEQSLVISGGKQHQLSSLRPRVVYRPEIKFKPVVTIGSGKDAKPAAASRSKSIVLMSTPQLVQICADEEQLGERKTIATQLLEEDPLAATVKAQAAAVHSTTIRPRVRASAASKAGRAAAAAAAEFDGTIDETPEEEAERLGIRRDEAEVETADEKAPEEQEAKDTEAEPEPVQNLDIAPELQQQESVPEAEAEAESSVPEPVAAVETEGEIDMEVKQDSHPEQEGAADEEEDSRKRKLEEMAGEDESKADVAESDAVPVHEVVAASAIATAPESGKDGEDVAIRRPKRRRIIVDDEDS